jgi:Uma2 family endonuclease
MAVVNARVADPRVSFAELERWPDDGRQYELYDGEVMVVPPAPFPRHQRVGCHIEALLREYEGTTGGLMFHAPFDVVLSEYDVVQPDVVFFRNERRHLINMMKPTRVPPDLAVEVLSRTTAARDRGRKMRLLARFGVPEYWIVDPVADTWEIYTLGGAGFELAGACDARDDVQSPSLRGLAFPASRMFDE